MNRTLSNDGLYTLFADSANEKATGRTIAVWDPYTLTPHPEYLTTRTNPPMPTEEFIDIYKGQIPEPEPIELFPE